MKLYKFGICLKRVEEQDIEIIRQWRNSDFVKNKMSYREYISSDAQKKWFQSINNLENNYYLIQYKGKNIGLINERNFEEDGKVVSDSGIFIGEKEYAKTHIPVLASMILIDLYLDVMQKKPAYIRVLKTNKEAQQYNKILGFRLLENQDEVENQWYVFVPELFYQNTDKLRKALHSLTDKDYPNGYVLFSEQDYEKGIAQKFEKIMENNKALSFFKQSTEDGIIYFYKKMNKSF